MRWPTHPSHGQNQGIHGYQGTSFNPPPPIVNLNLIHLITLELVLILPWRLQQRILATYLWDLLPRQEAIDGIQGVPC